MVQAEDGVHGLEVLEGVTRRWAFRPTSSSPIMNMPRMDGFGFIEGVRRNALYRSVPILVLTTEGEPDKKDRARRAGATGWIVKPFDPEKLISAIRRLAA